MEVSIIVLICFNDAYEFRDKYSSIVVRENFCQFHIRIDGVVYGFKILNQTKKQCLKRIIIYLEKLLTTSQIYQKDYLGNIKHGVMKEYFEMLKA